MDKKIKIIGAGLAGSEAAWQIAKAGIAVELYEMRGNGVATFAHKTSNCAELVCSNSFRSDDHENNAVGLLHEEMRRLNSLIMQSADKHKIPAGGALAVDREMFSDEVTSNLKNHNLINVIDKEIKSIDEVDDGSLIIIATGPLTSDSLSESILKLTGEEHLAFFDAIAPIIYAESVNMDVAWFQSRYDKGDGADYLNCPMNKEQYDNFINELINADKTEFKEWEKNTPYFEGCLPVEVMAERGIETLRYGPLKPVGLTNAHKPQEKPHAILQLRYENKNKTLMNMVGFQTKMTYGEQKRVFRMIPGLENAEFARLGGIHRNSFINSPLLLDSNMRLKSRPNIRFAGQITGVEGYVESAASGLMAGLSVISEIAADNSLINNESLPPRETAMGSLIAHITGEAEAKHFQPMNINFGLFKPLDKRVTKKQRAPEYSKRSLDYLGRWIAANNQLLHKKCS